MTPVKRVCLVPHLSGVGGMVSFQHKLAAGLGARRVEVCFNLANEPYDAVLVVGGTRQIGGLWRARKRGVRVVQRLDGMNWVHRRRRTGLRHFLRAEVGNLLLSLIRSRLADHIVYQSEFSQRWWERVHGLAPVSSSVIYNAVDLSIYTPHGPEERPESGYRVLLVEGSLMGGYEMGLEVAVALVNQLAAHLESSHSLLNRGPVELMVAGRVSPEVQERWNQHGSRASLCWAGLVPRERIPDLDRSAHLLYSADINAACPNSVIEALACGLPVVSFDTGALPELVPARAGRIVPYGGDPWKLDPPDIGALVEGCIEVLAGGQRIRQAARARAEEAFGLDQMVDRYMAALL